jgi:disulfide bond formation protein DsbB
MNKVSVRQACLLAALAGLAALGVAYFGEFVEHLVPCPLCYIERWPYRIIILLGLIGAIAPRFGRPALALVLLTMLGDGVIAFVHIGAEQHWWKSPLPECNIAPLSMGAMPLRPSASCDSPVYLIHGLPISFATMDFCTALSIAGLIAAYLMSTGNGSVL